MAATPVRHALIETPGVQRRESPPRRSSSMRRALASMMRLAMLVAVVAALAVARSGISAGLPGAAPVPITAKTAGTAFSNALKPGAGGVSFTVVQRSSVNARPGGPLVAVPDPSSPTVVIGQTDHYDLGSMIERGGVSSNGFWMEMRDGPSAGASPDFANAKYEFGTIVKGGLTYRSDGTGWYVTDRPPGIGIDPATAALIPTLLADSGATTPLPPTTIGGISVRQLAATAKVSDIPGLLAVDGAGFTELTAPLELGFDDTGRLVRIHGVARNTRLDTWDLLVDVVITFDYGTAGPIPDPSPIAVPSSGLDG